jgi:hypothetical protein
MEPNNVKFSRYLWKIFFLRFLLYYWSHHVAKLTKQHMALENIDICID